MTAKISISPIDLEVLSYILVSDQTLGKEDNNLWRGIGFITSKVQIHPFDIIKMELKATDKISGIGRNLECDVSGSVTVHGAKLKDVLADELIVGGIFDLIGATKYVGKGGILRGKLTTKDTKPAAYIKVHGEITGKSVDDYVAEAKKEAMAAKEAERKAK